MDMSDIAWIEPFTNALGQVRHRVAYASTLYTSKAGHFLHSWAKRSDARRAARTMGYRIVSGPCPLPAPTAAERASYRAGG